MSAFFEVHRGLPRQGPGLPADVHWALATVGLSGPLRLLDAGCGPGADSETLLEALPEATVLAVDTHAPFVEEAAARCARFGARFEGRAVSMAEIDGRFDFVWCAGALYFLGIGPGLAAFRCMLAPGAAVAFSEPVRLGAEVPAFWAEEYPGIGSEAEIRAQIAEAGYRTEACRILVGAPWEAYYAPMAARVAALRAEGSPDPALVEALAEAEREIAAWRAERDTVAYGLFVVRPE